MCSAGDTVRKKTEEEWVGEGVKEGNGELPEAITVVVVEWNPGSGEDGARVLVNETGDRL